MASRKLKVDIEVDGSKAKRKIAEAVPDVSESAASSARSLSASQDRLTKATEVNSTRMLSMTRAFSGMALGLAASYSARYFDKGSKEEKALGYAGSAISGASAGAAMAAPAGPQAAALGGIAGGIVGILKEYFDRDKLVSDMSKDYEKSESEYEGNMEFASQMSRITSPFNGESTSLKLATLSDHYNFYAKCIAQLKESIDEAIDNGEVEKVNELRSFLSRFRARKDTVYSLAEKLYTSNQESPVASRSSLTTLQKIGGGVQQSAPGSSGEITRIADVKFDKHGNAITSLLKEIRDKLGIKKDESWQ